MQLDQKGFKGEPFDLLEAKIETSHLCPQFGFGRSGAQQISKKCKVCKYQEKSKTPPLSDFDFWGFLLNLLLDDISCNQLHSVDLPLGLDEINQLELNQIDHLCLWKTI